MPRITSAALFFFLATLISHVFTHSLLERDDIGQLQQSIELFTGDLSALNTSITQASPFNGLKAQGQDLISAFDTTTGDLQNAINNIKSIKNIDAGDAQIVLRLAQDFKPGILGVLGNLRFKFDFFKKSNQEATILNQVNVLDGGVTQLMGNLENVVPVEYQGQASSLQQSMGPAFQQTIQLYSS